MENKVVGFIPKILYRIFLYLKDKFDSKPEIKQEEQFCVEICKKLIEDENSELHYTPISHKRLIRNDNQDMFIVIENRVINLINHVYSYSVYIENDTFYTEVLDCFDKKIAEVQGNLEKQIRDNIQHSLKKILEKVS